MAIPCVGIFWGITDETGNHRLLVEKTEITTAESYGDCLTHAGGHYEFWEKLSQLGVSKLRSLGLPIEPAIYEYEQIPRGRVVYWPQKQRFIIYADRRLQTKVLIEKIAEEFSLPSDTFSVRSDSHYQ